MQGKFEFGHIVIFFVTRQSRSDELVVQIWSITASGISKDPASDTAENPRIVCVYHILFDIEETALIDPILYIISWHAMVHSRLIVNGLYSKCIMYIQSQLHRNIH